MRMWIKPTPSDICVHENVIRPDYVVRNYWPLAALLKVLEVYADSASFVDWDDDPIPYALIAHTGKVSCELMWDLEAAKILKRYEDACYYRGPNFEKFAAYIMRQHEANPVEVTI